MNTTEEYQVIVGEEVWHTGCLIDCSRYIEDLKGADVLYELKRSGKMMDVPYIYAEILDHGMMTSRVKDADGKEWMVNNRYVKRVNGMRCQVERKRLYKPTLRI